MRFPNALKGISKLFAAEILKLIAVGLVIAGGIAGIVGGSTVISEALEGGDVTEQMIENVITAPGVIIGVLFAVGAMILYIIAYILNLVGLGQASRDEDDFRNAFYISIGVLVLTIVTAILAAVNVGGGAPGDISSTARTICEIIVMLSVINGIMVLSDALNNERMRSFGKVLMIIVIISVGASAAARFISIFFGNNSVVQNIDGVLGIIAGIAAMVGYIVYIIYLGKARKMLKEAR